MCAETGVQLEFLPPYSPDFNPIEESFAGLKAWMKRNRELASVYGDDFRGFIELAISEFADNMNARGYFRSAGIFVEEVDDGDSNLNND